MTAGTQPVARADGMTIERGRLFMAGMRRSEVSPCAGADRTKTTPTPPRIPRQRPRTIRPELGKANRRFR